jgi:hypothetical protein
VDAGQQPGDQQRRFGQRRAMDRDRYLQRHAYADTNAYSHADSDTYAHSDADTHASSERIRVQSIQGHEHQHELEYVCHGH